MADDLPDWAQQHFEEEAFLRSQLTVTESDYREAVSALVKLAQGDTSGSRAAAQVLLSLYNGSAWHMDLSDLGVLDLRYLQYALIAIRGRVVLMREPHRVIDNGDRIFDQLCELWQHLNTWERYSEKYRDE